MARQSTSPVAHRRATRVDTSVTMTSGRAGKVIPIGYFPLLRGDSCSGRVGVDGELAEMPRPLLNGVVANVQAWFVPKSAHPQFSGPDEFMHSYLGEDIKSLGVADRAPPPYFHVLSDALHIATAAESAFFRSMGVHIRTGQSIHSDLIDAFNLIYNFRLAAHSSRLTRRKYAQEDLDEALELPPAFWPSGRFSRVVPDYERALVVGSLDLDVVAGRLPVSGLGLSLNANPPNVEAAPFASALWSDGSAPALARHGTTVSFASEDSVAQIFAEMEGQSVGVSLADIDKARLTQAFAKLRTAYAGNDATGFDNDDVIVATLMQGFQVPPDQFKRPWLLDSKRVPVGFVERHATDGASLDASVTQGRFSAMLSINVPQVDAGGVVMFTVEVLPERIDEAASDEWLRITDTSALPDALRDIQRPEPVDMVLNRRLDARHSTPNGLYGYEPMNDVWNREFTRLGGSFFQEDPTNPFDEQRSAIWLTSIVDPTFTKDHFLVPEDFPHDVFADTEADAFELVCRHQVTIVGLTQIGDVLAENNDDYDAVKISEE